MHRHWTCACGHMVHADEDDELVGMVQEHMRTGHGKEVSREEVLRQATEAQH
jgi:predicted small metal-binding protein